MAYLNEDVRLPVPDIEKIQSDIKRLKDFIAYKVNHSDEERVQYRSQNGSLIGGTPPNRKERKGTKGFLEGTNFDDTTPYNLHGNISTRDDSRESTRDDMNMGINQAELDLLKIDTLRLKEEAILAKTQAEESRSKLDISEAQAASFIGKIGTYVLPYSVFCCYFMSVLL
jgi:hypothetical protein